MKRHKVWWAVIGLLLIAWVPFLLEEAIHKLGGRNYYPDQEVGLMFGFWLFIWWPCHVLVALIVIYQCARWCFRRVTTPKT